MNMRCLCVLLILIVSIGLTSQVFAQDQPSNLTKFMVDENIWGKDAFAVFAWMKSWRQIKVKQIVVFQDKVMVGEDYKVVKKAQLSSLKLESAAKAAQPRFKPFYEKKFKGRVPSTPPFKSAIWTNPEDDSIRLVWKGEKLNIFRKDLALSLIFKTYGKPERKTTQLVQNKMDTRPILLTFYHYAGGAIQFVESDPAPGPDLVSRIVLDINSVSAELFEGGKNETQ